jgi:hypothetical protein
MNSNPHNPMTSNSDSGANFGEDTLRLIASLPAPEGIEERVHKALRSAPPRKGQVVAWPAEIGSRVLPQSIHSNWMRAAAAAAIVFVVVGGGWGVYSRVEQGQSGKVVVMPARVPGSSGFAGAGAIRTPQTLPGPTIREQATPAGSEGASHRSEQGTPAAKKPSAPKKLTSSSSQPTATQVAPPSAVSK